MSLASYLGQSARLPLTDDFLGGKVMPPPPAGLSRTAASLEGYGRRTAALLPDYRRRTSAALAKLPDLVSRETEDLTTARLRSQGQGDDYAELWADAVPVLQQSIAEVAEAGSENRQMTEERRAREAVHAGFADAIAAREDAALRSGLGAGYSLDNPNTLASEAAAAAAAGNAARLRERDYGENVRRGFVPVAQGYGESAAAKPREAAMTSGQQVLAQLRIPQAATDFMNAEAATLSRAGSLAQAAQGGYATQYHAELAKAQGDNARQAAIAANRLAIEGMNKEVPGAVGGGRVFSGGGGAASLRGDGNDYGYPMGSYLTPSRAEVSNFDAPRSGSWLKPARLQAVADASRAAALPAGSWYR